MESDHEARIERLELMVKESQDQMLRQQNEMQTQMARLVELMTASMREKGQASTAETRNDPPNVESPLPIIQNPPKRKPDKNNDPFLHLPLRLHQLST